MLCLFWFAPKKKSRKKIDLLPSPLTQAGMVNISQDVEEEHH